MNDPVKDHEEETADSYSQHVQNNSKENQNINIDMMIEVDAQSVSNEFKGQGDKENKDRQVNELTGMISQLELNNGSVNPTKASSIAPTIKKSKMTYKDPDSKEWKIALVVSRAGKACGKNKYWFNIKDLDDNTMKSLDFENIRFGKTLVKKYCCVRENHLR